MQLHMQRHSLFPQVLNPQTGRENIFTQLIEDQDFPYERASAGFV